MIQGKNEGLFAASRMKLVRARMFIDELIIEADAYAKSKPVTGHLVLENGEHKAVMNWRGVGLKPGAIVGDAVHNMRTSLDLMASELARLNGKSDSAVYFPFANSMVELDVAIKKKNFQRAGAECVALLRQFAPYRGGNKLLRLLHDLDIWDKHRALIITGVSIDVEFKFQYSTEPYHPIGAEFFVHDVFFQLTLEEHELAGVSIVDILKDLMRVVEGVLESFERLSLARAV